MIAKNCPICSKTFFVKPSHSGRRTYCSKPCMSEGYKDRLKGSVNPNYKNAGIRTCLNCNEDYKDYSKTQKYCSPVCSRAHRAKLKAEGHPIRTRKIYKVYICPDCGAMTFKSMRGPCELCKEVRETMRNLWIYPTCRGCKEQFCVPYSNKRLSGRLYCSRECAEKDRNGKRNPGYIDGRTPKNTRIRHSKKYAGWRKSVFERDNYTCLHCGQRGGRIEADHIQPFSTHPNLRFDINNGRTLCIDCHKKTPTYLGGARRKSQNSTPIQRARQDELRAAGCKVYEIHSLEEMQQVA
jgi:5-methylcytosine-specific restriction endonuclease McrA